MCNAVRFQIGDDIYTMNTSHPRPALPVLMADESVKMFPWGRHSQQPGKLPLGFVARRDAVLGGKWDKWFPKRVLIPFQAFMIVDFEQRQKWYENAMKSYLVGLVAKDGNEKRVYVVIDSPDIATQPYHETEPLTTHRTLRKQA